MANHQLKMIPIVDLWRNKFQKFYSWNTYSILVSRQLLLNKHESLAVNFLKTASAYDLARLLNTPVQTLEYLVNNPVYNEFVRKKRRGGKRIIHEPNNRLKTVQKKLNIFLQNYYLTVKPPHIHGFIINPDKSEKTCNIVENARPHINKKHLLNIDLKDFFFSIRAKSVKQLFLSEHFQFNEHLATVLALLLTYKGTLPTGAPTSPAISNFLCLNLDSELINFCESKNISFTRYADDLTFSADMPFEKSCIREIKKIIEKNHFIVNNQKIRICGANRKQTVTGLVVNNKINVDRRFIRKIRAIIYDCKTNGLLLAAISHFGVPKDKIKDSELRKKLINTIIGYVDFIGQVRGRKDKIYLKFKADLIEVVNQPVSKA